MLQCNKDSIESLHVSDLEALIYKPIPLGEEWRMNVVHELVGIKAKEAELPGFTPKEVQDMLNFVCTS